MKTKLAEMYQKLRETSQLIKDPKYENVYVLSNQKQMDALREQYISEYPEEKRLAILLMKKINYASFENEVDGLEDKWNYRCHAAALKAAKEILKYTDFDTACKISSIILDI